MFAPPQVHHQTVFDILEVGGAFAQVLAVAGFHTLPVMGQHLHHRVVCIVTVLPDVVEDGFVQCLISKHQQLRFEDAGVLLTQFLAGHVPDLAQAVLGLRHGPLEALDLGLYLVIGQPPLLHVEGMPGIDVGRSDRDARGHGNALEDLLPVTVLIVLGLG